MKSHRLQMHKNKTSYQEESYFDEYTETFTRFCSFYKSDKEYKEIFAREAFYSLKAGKKVVLLESNVQESRSNLKILNSISDFSNQKKLKNIIALNFKSYFNSSNELKIQPLMNLIEKELNTAREQGFVGLQIISNKQWFSKNAINLKLLLTYEAQFNRIICNNKSISELSLFEVNKIKPEILDKIIEIYPSILLDGEVFNNQYYIPIELNQKQYKGMQSFEYKLKQIKESTNVKLSKPKVIANNNLGAIFYKLAHDIRGPIRSANLINTIIQREFSSFEPNELLNKLDLMSKSLAQAYEKVGDLEKFHEELEKKLK